MGMFNNNEGNGDSKMPNMNVVKGLLAIIFGVMFMVFAYKIILNIIFFVAGLMLIYYGLLILNMKHVLDYVDQLVNKIKRLFG